MSEEQAVEVEARKSFAHGSERRSGEHFLVSKQHADALVRGGLVQVVAAAAAAAAAAEAEAEAEAEPESEPAATAVARKSRRSGAAE